MRAQPHESGAQHSRDQASIVQDNIEEGAVNLEHAIVLDEAELAEPIHEKVNARARSAHNLGQRFLAHFWGLRSLVCLPFRSWRAVEARAPAVFRWS